MRYLFTLTLLAAALPSTALADGPGDTTPAKLAPDALTTADWVSVAKQFTEHDDTARAALAWCRVLAADPAHALARRALRFKPHAGGWAPESIVMPQRGFTAWGNGWLLNAVAAQRVANGTVRPTPAATTVRRLRAAYNIAQTANGRSAVLHRLAECGSAAAGVALARVATRDTDITIRAQALTALRAHGPDEAAYALHALLRSGSGKESLRAAEAMGTLEGSRLAPRMLAANWINALGRGPRVNISVGAIKAYVADFEVEVASYAAIGDPHVGVMREGAILDHQVLTGTRVMTAKTIRASRRSLAALVGRDLGNDPRRWAAYLNADSPEGAK